MLLLTNPGWREFNPDCCSHLDTFHFETQSFHHFFFVLILSHSSLDFLEGKEQKDKIRNRIKLIGMRQRSEFWVRKRKKERKRIQIVGIWFPFNCCSFLTQFFLVIELSLSSSSSGLETAINYKC